MQGRHIHKISQPRGQREDGVEAVIPNLSWRYSGGTATNQAIAPGLARLLCVAWLGPDRPEGVGRLTLRDLLRLRARRPSPVVWHARRNIEMAVGLLLKSLGWPFVLIFTSAAQRHHTAITRWMISRVDAVIAPSAASASFAHRPAAVIPNLSWRYSGGTATNQAIAPGLARLLCVAWLGPDRPEGVARLTLRDLLRLRARRPSPVVWHARRNIEMAVGLLLKTLGWPFVLIFTSAGRRHHTAITRWMINRVNAALGADRAAAWAATGLPGHYGIGCFGRVRRQKGTDLFVTAMCRLLPRFPDYTAVVIGATTASHRAFVARLNAQAAAAGLSDRILFLGALPTPDVQRWFGRLSI